MDPDQLDPATAPATTDPNAALAKLLQAELAAHEAQGPKTAASSEPTMFGMTMGAIFLGFVLSVIGLALANYGRKMGDIVLGVFGVCMMIVPFFVTTTPWLLVAGVVLIGAPVLLKKLQVI